ncbi:hypothetical protein GGQ80_003167 [Sphingomonas jinjuensis]|uniref:Uncharacterized protein n=1 Tax=Sphingomonas jinjuensis TaxID=535907 RepID=A0A840FC88_9SPHN|nr:hypothetical protein [Sphingomonas jinjuensis]MBB4155249.1 hypothetical protein [Sphingomonas jinjuensis]
MAFRLRSVSLRRRLAMVIACRAALETAPGLPIAIDRSSGPD